MLLSRIIKAEESHDFRVFNFGEIQGRVSPKRECEEDGPAAGGEREVPDPLEELEKTIQRRLLEIERRAQEIESEAYEKGYAQGLKDGAEYGRKSIEVTKEHLQKLLSDMQLLPGNILKDYRDWLVSSCISISKMVVRRELDIHPEILTGVIDGLVKEAEGSYAVTIYLHPKDLELLTRHVAFQDLIKQAERPLTLKPDPRAARGACRLETDIQVIDAGVDTQFALIEEALSRNVCSAEGTASD